MSDRQIDARIRQLAARSLPPEEICVRLCLSWQRVARVLGPAVQPAPAAPEEPPVQADSPPAKVATAAPVTIIPQAEPEAAEPSAAPAPYTLDPIEGRVLELLTAAAQAGLRCPANSAMAGILALGQSSVCRAVQVLAEHGLIRIARKGPQRRISIVNAGCTTDWSPHPRSRGGGMAITPPGFDHSVVDQARRLLMSRDYEVLSAGPALFKVDGRIRTADELVSMANRTLQLMNRPPLSRAAA
ncbi:MAG TPA: hypothetical protein VD995_03170 [Azospirillum sp.]|nr:hypothetical protein [Azospirillum sp.]